MANTKTSAKRARQALQRQSQNQRVRNATRTRVKLALESLQKKDVSLTQASYQKAVQALSKAASKGAIPKRRASRKISRLTHLVQKTLPEAFTQKATG